MHSRVLLLLWLALSFWKFSEARAAETNATLVRAIASVEQATPRATADPTRPTYHFHSPANWMNDPNGPIYHSGVYHMFYQLNPYGDQWGNMHWGHARSRDLVHWEHLPIALWPSKERNEDHCFSGCATIGPDGKPMIIYTSIGYGKGAGEYAEQWAATSDDTMLTWRKHPANPLLSEKLHGDLKVYDWRDPFIFEAEGQRFLVLGGNLNRAKGGQAVVNLYRAENKELTEWKFLGVLFTHPDAAVKNIECPNFFKLGDKWALVISPHGKVQYFIGTFDPKAAKFTAETRGLIDESDQYYAPNCLLDPQGRRIMWGWVRGFKAGLGWNGCLTLPRVLTLGNDGHIRQRVISELEQLRGEPALQSDVALSSNARVLEKAAGDSMEIETEFDRGDAKKFGLRLRRSENGERSVVVSFEGDQLDVAGLRVPLRSVAAEGAVTLRIFLDKSVLEVFVNGRAAVTRVIQANPGDLGVEVFAENGTARAKRLSIWPIKSIW